MAKYDKLEESVAAIMQAPGAAGCIVTARAGSGDPLYHVNLDGCDGPLIGTILASLLLLGESLGKELGESVPTYQLLELAGVRLILVPCAEMAAIAVLIRGSDDLEPTIAMLQRLAGELALELGA